MTTDPNCPVSSVDLWADAVLENPYPAYSDLRDLGAVVWLSRFDAYVLPRYDEVRAALQDHATYSSAQGVGMDPVYNGKSNNGILTSDPPIHDTRRHASTRAQPATRPAGTGAARDDDPYARGGTCRVPGGAGNLRCRD